MNQARATDNFEYYKKCIILNTRRIIEYTRMTTHRYSYIVSKRLGKIKIKCPSLGWVPINELSNLIESHLSH